MTTAEAIAKLESLLERVRMRAGARAGVEPSLGAPIASEETVDAPVQMSTWTPPPPEDPEPDALAVDVDFSETTRTDVAASRLDSAERLVVVESATGYSATRHEVEADGDGLHASSAEEADDELAADGDAEAPTTNPDDLEEPAVERAPASSRRPVMPDPEDRLEQMAFGSGEAPPPLHTPPPESGRVPAAPADEFDSEAPEAEEAVQPDEPLVAEATHAQLESSANVARIVGAKRRPTPATFLAALEEALAL